MEVVWCGVVWYLGRGRQVLENGGGRDDGNGVIRRPCMDAFFIDSCSLILWPNPSSLSSLFLILYSLCYSRRDKSLELELELMMPIASVLDLEKIKRQLTPRSWLNWIGCFGVSSLSERKELLKEKEGMRSGSRSRSGSRRKGVEKNSLNSLSWSWSWSWSWSVDA